MSPSDSAPHIAILGTGLIGASLALALRAARRAEGLDSGGGASAIIGWDRPEVLARAQARGIIDRAAPTPEAACQDAAVIVLALPIGTILDVLPRVAAAAPPGALITDTGSTKRRICAAAAAALASRPDVHFLGGHPMAGRAQGGIEHAAAGLFAGAAWLLIGEAAEPAPAASSSPALAADPRPRPHGTGWSRQPGRPPHRAPAARAWAAQVARLGARPLWTTAALHDAALARLSHLPQLLSTALGAQLSETFAAHPAWAPLRAAAGPGARDMLRLAASPYYLWRDILLTNSDELDAALGEMQQTLDWLRVHLRDRAVEAAFAAAAAALPASPETEP